MLPATQPIGGARGTMRGTGGGGGAGQTRGPFFSLHLAVVDWQQWSSPPHSLAAHMTGVFLGQRARPPRGCCVTGLLRLQQLQSFSSVPCPVVEGLVLQRSPFMQTIM